jgi:myo-inositol 2-dehydrogenase/D-chiro-inositol 1-dehydrogenase
MTVKVGIIGAGYIGGVHARILAQDERVKLVGIADVVETRAKELAMIVGAQPFPSAEALLAAGVDAVYVCTPNTMHLAPVLAALQAGGHVFSEKPMATSLAEARQILDATRSAKGLYQIGHNRRFAPVYKFAKQMLAAGFRPTSAHIKMNRGELKNPPWVSDCTITGGFLYETTVHLLDMARWLLGEVVEVECRGRQSVYDELDDFTMILSFSDNRYATFASCAHTTWAFPFERIELYGDHAQIVTEEMEKVSYSPGLGQEIVLRDYFQLAVPQKWGYAEEDRLFITSILEGQPPAVTAEDGYKSIDLVGACYRSARHGGERIHLPL